MLCYLRLLLSASLLLATLGSARAHYLFIRICPPAEAGRKAEVYFSDLAEAGDPRFVAKIAHTQLWLQSEPGKFSALKVNQGTDRLSAHLPSSGSAVVIGSCQYGVLARPNQTAFLLRHYPKAMAGSPADLNQMKPYPQVPLEIMANVAGGEMRLVALREGKPLSKAEFITVNADLKNEKLTADGDGQATWKPPATGSYSIYTSYTTKAKGSADGKAYAEIREFATLAFTWPLERTDADAGAVTLFEDAIAARAQWRNFPGFTAEIAGNVDGRTFTGKVGINAQGVVLVETEELAIQPWVQEQLESIVLHRIVRGGSTTPKEKPVLRFAETRDEHPLGRLVIFDGGRFASSYRIKDRQLLVVNRQMGRQNMTITVLDNDKNLEGLFLPHSYTVQYWDDNSGELQRTETVQERWQRVGDWDLPAAHTVTVATKAGLAVRSVTVSKHRLLTAK